MSMLQVCIPDKLTDQLREYCKAHRMTLKESTSKALEEMFNKEKEKETNQCKN